jgi:O-antigen/teichoic acid export membrane protein
MTYIGLVAAQYSVLFVVGVVAARALKPAGRAEYALPFALATIVWSTAHLSLGGAAGRLWARREAPLHDIVAVLSGSTLCIGPVAVVVTVVLGGLGNGALVANAPTSAVILAALCIPFLLAALLAGDILMRLGAFTTYALWIAASAVIQLALVLAFNYFLDLTPSRVLTATLISSAVSATGLTLVLGRIIGYPALVPRLPSVLTRKTLRIGLVLHAGSVAIQLGSRIDLVIVSMLVTQHDAGLYSLALVLSESVFLVCWGVSNLSLRTQTHAAEAVAADYTVGFTRRLFLIALGTALVAGVAAAPCIRFVYGSDWAGSIVPFILLMIGAVALTIEGPLRTLLARVARPVMLSMIALAGLLLNIALTIAFTPWLGITGAAIASIVAYWSYALALLLAAERTTVVSIRDFINPRSRAVESTS